MILVADDIFAPDPENDDIVVESPSPSGAVPPELAEFVGEGKKYKTAEDALKSIPHAQSHIQKLEEEMKALKEKALRADVTEELLEELRKQGINPPAGSETTSQTPAVSPADIEKTVEQVLAQRESAKLAKSNASAVTAAFAEAFGDKGKEKYEEVAAANGLSLDALNSLARSAPSAVLKLAGLKQKGGKDVPRTTPSIRTEGLQSNPGELSARVPPVGATTRDLVAAWRVAGEKVNRNT